MSDFLHTGDWFYSFRWVPPKHFKLRLECNSKRHNANVLPDTALFEAHSLLSPAGSNNLLHRMTPATYRRRFKEQLAASGLRSEDVVQNNHGKKKNQKAFQNERLGNYKIKTKTKKNYPGKQSKRDLRFSDLID